MLSIDPDPLRSLNMSKNVKQTTCLPFDASDLSHHGGKIRHSLTSGTFSLWPARNLLGEQAVAGVQPLVILLTLQTVNAGNKLDLASLS